MRILALAILAADNVLAAAPARAQTYAPGYPVCLHVYDPVSYYECSATRRPRAARRSAWSIPISGTPPLPLRPFAAIAGTTRPTEIRR